MGVSDMSALTAYFHSAAAVCLLTLTVGAHALTPSLEAQSRALQRASHAVVGVQTVAVEDGRSVDTLGRFRKGSGVVIGADGLVLTIGYLVLEAEQVELITEDGRRLPARVVGYDVATGFGIVKSLVPLRLEPVPLGDATALGHDEPLMVASGGDEGSVGATRLVSRRPFSGYWEYHVDSALFVSPPRRDHGGAGLFNGHGELVGIGSLVVSDAAGGEGGRVPGNMFVPVDLLKPILGELLENGSSRLSARAWIGMNCEEQDGAIRVVRVGDDSPAEVGGLQRGDLILRIDGVQVARLDQLWKTLWSGASPEREVTMMIQRDGEVQTLRLQSVDRAKTLRSAQGV
jgi:serine protease Do